MNRSVQKVIDKLIKYGKSNLRCFEEGWFENPFNQNVLVTSIILLYFEQVDFGVDILEDKSNVDIVFLDPQKIFNAVEKIHTNIKEQVSFLEWYLKGVTAFYTTKSLEHYKQMGCTLSNKIDYFFTTTESIKMAHYKRIKKSDKPETSYASYKTICEKIEKLYQGGILYTQQYHLLSQLGMSEELVKKIKTYQVSFLLNSFNKPEIIKKENHKNNKISATSTVAENIFVKQNSSPSHRSLKDKLNQYLDLSNLQNKMVIEGEIFYKVDELLRKIYSEEKVSYVEKRILVNNAKMKQEMYATAMKELLPNEDDYQLFQEVKESLHKELKNDPFFSPYSKLTQNIVTEIDNYLYDYIELNHTDKELLKEDYINLIVLCLGELKPHIDFLPLL